MPSNPTCPSLLALCQERELQLPGHPTVVNLTRLITSYNANTVAGGNHNVKRMLVHSINKAGRGRGLRYSTRAGLTNIRRCFRGEQRAPREALSPGAATASGVRPVALPSAARLAGDESGAVNSADEAVLALQRDQLRFAVEKHRDDTSLARRQLDFDERKWMAQLSRTPSPPALVLPSAPRLEYLPPMVSAADPPLLEAHPPARTRYSSLGSACTSQALAAPAAVIQPTLGGPLMTVLENIVGLARGDPATRGLFSGPAALDAALEVTPRRTPLRRHVENLKRGHNVYLRMLSWMVEVLGASGDVIIRVSAGAGDSRSFSLNHHKRAALERAFVLIEPRVQTGSAVGACRSLAFRGATSSTLRDVLQGRNGGRRREIASFQLLNPLFKTRVTGTRAHWRKTYGLTMPEKKSRQL